MKIRPLRDISDFVADGAFAEALETPSDKLAHQVQALIDALTPQDIAEAMRDGISTSIARLDLTMTEAGLAHSGLRPDPRLCELVDTFSGAEISGLDYQSLVFVNPPYDMRSFTRGAVREMEVHFYLEHRRIEEHLVYVVSKVRKALETTAAEGASEILGGIEENLGSIIASTKGLREMPLGHFPTFRKFLATHPLRNLKGPSGAFSPGIPVLELLLRGDELPSAYGEYLTANWPYFPPRGREELNEAQDYVRRGQTLVTLWRKNKESLLLGERIRVLCTFFDQFRRTHLATVGRQLSEALAGKVAGTAGESNPGEFLRGRMEMTRFNKGGRHGKN